ncbi:MAG: EF2563 family selenium-dependent molybdenum hydroxylase system protein [Anaerolinea sp.]|nr:EF2563 family selenium-dependent molybdenum hydroxylase system protein [Anaerolinea sp.]
MAALFVDKLVIIRGGGDLATGVAYRLQQAGFPLLVLELARPLVVRRRVALATAVLEGAVDIEELHGRLVHSVAEAMQFVYTGIIPILVAPQVEPVLDSLPAPTAVIVDARIAKRNIDTRINQAPLVIGMGPGFTAAVDCHAVIETMRGHTLGKIIWSGTALPNTGTPGVVAGKGAERVLRAPQAGVARWRLAIGQQVKAGDVLGDVDGMPVTAPFAGVVRGQIAPGTAVSAGMKIGDVDARGVTAHCFTISDKALALGGAVLAAILAFYNRQKDV